MPQTEFYSSKLFCPYYVNGLPHNSHLADLNSAEKQPRQRHSPGNPSRSLVQPAGSRLDPQFPATSEAALADLAKGLKSNEFVHL